MYLFWLTFFKSHSMKLFWSFDFFYILLSHVSYSVSIKYCMNIVKEITDLFSWLSLHDRGS